jgi:hypothetical protein
MHDTVDALVLVLEQQLALASQQDWEALWLLEARRAELALLLETAHPDQLAGLAAGLETIIRLHQQLAEVCGAERSTLVGERVSVATEVKLAKAYGSP